VSRRLLALVAVSLAVVLVVAFVVRRSTATGDAATAGHENTAQPDRDLGEPAAGEVVEGEGRGNPEAAEQLETTDQRLEALREARQAGTLAVDTSALSTAPAAGWSGEYVVNKRADDWEPAVAADPNAPYVYVVTTRYGAGKPCKGNCPDPWMALTVSKDGGATWSDQVPLCACKGSGQYDPIVEVVPDNGDVYALYMNGYNVVFIRSTDHGKTWTRPVATYGNVSWNDKPVLATSDDGRDIYVSWNGPQGGDPWIAQSHDRGRTWTQTRLKKAKDYYYAFDADVTHTGRVIFAETSVVYQSSVGLTGKTKTHAIVSKDGGTTWKDVVVDAYPAGLAAEQRADYYAGHAALSADGDGNLVIAYDAPTTAYGLQRIYIRRSTDGGSTWSARTAVSANGEMAIAPAIESRGHGDVRMYYFQTANGGDVDAWNVWYRSSTDGGATWTSPVNISDASGGAVYKSADGFLEPYGDYGEMGITSAGKTIAAWGEGRSYIGPGGVWINRQI
jgi:BNR repeat-like domain